MQKVTFRKIASQNDTNKTAPSSDEYRTDQDTCAPRIYVAEKRVITLRPKEAATLIGVDAKTLANWRWGGKGPPFFKLPGRMNKGPVRYDRDTVLTWLSSDIRRSTSDPGGGDNV